MFPLKNVARTGLRSTRQQDLKCHKVSNTACSVWRPKWYFLHKHVKKMRLEIILLNLLTPRQNGWHFCRQHVLKWKSSNFEKNFTEFCSSGSSEWVSEIKFIGLFENRGHRGPYSPYKPFNHNLYIGIIIFPHIDNPQYTGYDLPKKKPNKIINEKKWGRH